MFIRREFQNLVEMQEVDEALNEGCFQAYAPADRWRCFFTPYSLSFVKTDYFLINSMYDTWQMLNIIAPPGASCCVS